MIAKAVKLKGASGRGLACQIMYGADVGRSGLSLSSTFRAKSLSFQNPAMDIRTRPYLSVTLPLTSYAPFEVHPRCVKLSSATSPVV